MWDKVESVLDDIRPFLQSDGGDVELVDVLDGVVSVRLVGACGSCPSATVTMKFAIERTLKEEIPEVTEVIQVDQLNEPVGMAPMGGEPTLTLS